MKGIKIYIHQHVFITYHEYFTWGEGMRERERVEYGTTHAYIADLSIPERLILDIQILVKSVNSKLKHSREDVPHLYNTLSELTNKDLVSIHILNDEELSETLVDIDSINLKTHEASIYQYYAYRPPLVTLESFNVQSHSRLPIYDSPYNEEKILEIMGLNFEERYLHYVNTEYIKKRVSDILFLVINGLLYKKLPEVIKRVGSYNFEEITGIINEICIDNNCSFRYLSKVIIDICVDKIAVLCESEFIKLKYQVLVSEKKYHTEQYIYQCLYLACADKTENNLHQIEELCKNYFADWLLKRNFRKEFWERHKPDKIFTDREECLSYIKEILITEEEGLDETALNVIPLYIMGLMTGLKHIDEKYWPWLRK